MLFTTETIKLDEVQEINNYFDNIEEEMNIGEETETPVYKYISCLVTDCYQQSVNDIANTKMDNRRIKRKNLQQIMQESFFGGANRFGNNFIA